MYDLIIVGAGAAGMTAAIYAARKKMDFLVITQDIGGQANWSGTVDNYTGYQVIPGNELMGKFEAHMRQFDFPINEREKVLSVRKEAHIIRVKTEKMEYDSCTAIIATGKCASELQVPGESEFMNKGVSYCATCDAPLFVNKDVVVVGGGNSALDAALQLIRLASRTYVINKAPSLTGDPVMQEKLLAASNATVMNDSVITEVLGERMVSGVRVKTGSEQRYIPVQGVFVEIGLRPNSGIISDVRKNELGEIIVNCSNETSVAGIYAAGDVSDVPEKQIVIAAGEGAKAALGAFRYCARNR